MKESLNTAMEGHIKVYMNDELVFDEHNTIHANATDVVLRALGVVSSKTNMIDTMKMIGAFGTKNIKIISAAIDSTQKTVTFTSRVEATDFAGVVTELYLIMGETNLTLAYKTGLTLTKDTNTVMLVVWQIKVAITI